jgi:hypothetical protein
LKDLRKAAFLEGFVSGGASFMSSKPHDFAHLRKRAMVRKCAIEGPARRASGARSKEEGIVSDEMLRGKIIRAPHEPSEIRVSADAIIEVRGTDVVRHVARGWLADKSTPGPFVDGGASTIWTVGDEYESWLRRSEARARKTRIAQAICAYALFAAGAALVIWYLLR